VKISLEKLCQLVENVFDEGRPESEIKRDNQVRIIKVFCNDELSKVEIRTDDELRYILESCVKGWSSVICEATEVWEQEEEGHVNVNRMVEQILMDRKLKPGEIIRPRTPDNLKKIRLTLMRDGFEKMKQTGLNENQLVMPTHLRDAIKGAARKRKSEGNLASLLGPPPPPPIEDDGAKISKRLMLQVVMDGKKSWEGDAWKWAKDVQRVFALNIRMVRLVFNLLDAPADHKNFTEAMNFVKNSPLPALMTNNRDIIKIPAPQELADWLLEMGFSVRFSKYTLEDSTKYEVIEPETIIRSTRVPIRYLLKSILIVLKATG